ncbi:hypothetical protein EGW08_023643, partial [Elysia chlorotica]
CCCCCCFLSPVGGYKPGIATGYLFIAGIIACAVCSLCLIFVVTLIERWQVKEEKPEEIVEPAKTKTKTETKTETKPKSVTLSSGKSEKSSSSAMTPDTGVSITTSSTTGTPASTLEDK